MTGVGHGYARFTQSPNGAAGLPQRAPPRQSGLHYGGGFMGDSFGSVAHNGGVFVGSGSRRFLVRVT